MLYIYIHVYIELITYNHNSLLYDVHLIVFSIAVTGFSFSKGARVTSDIFFATRCSFCLPLEEGSERLAEEN